MTRLRAWGTWCLALLLALWLPAFAQNATQSTLVPVPAYRAHVTDTTGVLSEADRRALEQQLADFETRRGTQIGVLLVPGTAPEDIADYSQRVADAWKLGRAGVGDGLLVVVALQERRVRIAPFKALEGAVPDVLAKRIIDEQIVPAFRQGDYAGGLRNALLQLQAHISGEALPAPDAASPRPQVDGFDIVEAAMLLLVAVPLVTNVLRQLLGQRLGSLAGSAAAGFLVWQITGRAWMALLAGLMGFFIGMFTRLPLVPRGRHYGGWGGPGGGIGGGFGGGGFGDGGGIGGGGGASSGGGGDGGGGGASGSW